MLHFSIEIRLRERDEASRVRRGGDEPLVGSQMTSLKERESPAAETARPRRDTAEAEKASRAETSHAQRVGGGRKSDSDLRTPSFRGAGEGICGEKKYSSSQHISFRRKFAR